MAWLFKVNIRAPKYCHGNCFMRFFFPLIKNIFKKETRIQTTLFVHTFVNRIYCNCKIGKKTQIKTFHHDANVMSCPSTQWSKAHRRTHTRTHTPAICDVIQQVVNPLRNPIWIIADTRGETLSYLTHIWKSIPKPPAQKEEVCLRPTTRCRQHGKKGARPLVHRLHMRVVSSPGFRKMEVINVTPHVLNVDLTLLGLG